MAEEDKTRVVKEEEDEDEYKPKETSCEDYIESDLFEKVSLKKPHNLGLFYDKIAEAFTTRLVFYSAVIYPFFGVYLNMQGHLYASINSVFATIWSLKLFWGFMSDSTPIFGKRRQYYMAIGWFISIIAYMVSVMIEYPEPYYETEGCYPDKSQVGNPEAPQAGVTYVSILSIAVLGVSVVDLSSDALVVDYTKREPLPIRGTTNAYTAICHNVGSIVLFTSIGFMLNSPEYGGTDCSLHYTFRDILIIFLAVSIFGFINSLLFTVDPHNAEQVSIKRQIKQFWGILKLRVYQRVCIVFIFVPALMNARSSGQVKVRKNWAEVTPFASSMASVISAALVALGMFLLQNCFLHKSWVKLYIYVKSYCLFVAFLVETATVFDIIRNQYFYFTEEMLSAVGIGMTVFILLQLAAEISESGCEALTFGMLMSNWTLSSSLSSILGNLASSPFGIVDDERYLRDSDSDRWAVYGSMLATFAINLLAFPVMYFLCPTQRRQVHDLKTQLGSSERQAKIYLAVFISVFLFSVSFNTLVMIPSTRCLHIVGGSGCSK